jgi:hypothetical protein
MKRDIKPKTHMDYVREAAERGDKSAIEYLKEIKDKKNKDNWKTKEEV